MRCCNVCAGVLNSRARPEWRGSNDPMPLPSLLSLLPSNCCGSSVRAGSSQHPGAVHAHAHVSAFEEAQVPMRTALLLHRERLSPNHYISC